MLIGDLINSRPAYAEEEMNDWARSSDSEIEFDGDSMYWIKTHNAAPNDNVIRYETMEYVVTKQKLDTNYNFNSGPNASVSPKVYIKQSTDVVGTDSNIKEREYSMNRNDFFANEFKLTDKELKEGVTLYLNPIFRTYQGNVTLKENIAGLPAMEKAAEWSQETRNRLPGLYNVTLTLIPNKNIFNYQVIATDLNKKSLDGAMGLDESILNNPLDTGEATFNQPITYSLPGNFSTVFKDELMYEYVGYEVVYQTSTGTKETSLTSGDVNFHAPSDVVPQSTVTIYMMYKEGIPKDYRVNVKAIVPGTQFTYTLQSTTPVKYKDIFNYTLPEDLRTLINIYTYTDSYYFTYTDIKGKSVTEGNFSGSSISYEMPNAKPGSIATFYMIYGPNGNPPEEEEPDLEISEVIVPEPDFASMAYTSVSANASILADNKGANKFVAYQGIPTTESLYGEARATEYIVGYSFTKHVGIKYYDVKVTKEYVLKWKEATPEEHLDGELPEVITEVIKKEQIVSVPRAYGYWEIDHLGFYDISNVRLNNYALPGGSVTLTPRGYSTPSMTVRHSPGLEAHVIPPKEAIEGITLPPVIIDGGTQRPVLPQSYYDENLEKYALAYTGMTTIKNDYVSWNGIVVMDDTEKPTEGPSVNKTAIQQCYSMTSEGTLYENNQIIEATKQNGDFASSGKVTYRAKQSVNRPSTLTYDISVNKVVIHTPVICDPTITANNDEWVQLINPDMDATHLVIDEDHTLNDFTVKVSNYGYHSTRLGYNTRDYAWSLRNSSVSYIAKAPNGMLRNEVRFPFDVYRDVGDDYDTSNDKFIKAGTWIAIGHTEPRFYLPMWVNEGTYDIQFRTVAVNGTNKLNYTEPTRNSRISNYVATDSIKVQVSGRIYGLTIYDISDYPMWREAFRVQNSSRLKLNYPLLYQDGTTLTPKGSIKPYNANYSYYYTLGTNDQYGNDLRRNNKYTFPLVNGSHPNYDNQGILKTGYVVRFKMQTTGEMLSSGSKVVIEPTFYHVDKNGKNRRQVDIYYTEEINNKSQSLIKVGSLLDQTNVKRIEIGNLNLAIPDNELRQTALLNGESYGKYILRRAAMMHGFSKIVLDSNFKTYVNQDYANDISNHVSSSDVEARGITESYMAKYKQNWYGQFYLPNTMHVIPKFKSGSSTESYVIPKGFKTPHGYITPKDLTLEQYASAYGIKYTEDFWLKDGYIIVNFNIYTIDGNGNKNISYINPSDEHCNMWLLENPPINKTGKDKVQFTFQPGDFVIYYVNKKAEDDYTPGTAW